MFAHEQAETVQLSVSRHRLRSSEAHTADNPTMKINDPFGRVSRRNQQQYDTFRQQLREMGVDNADQCRTFTRNATLSFVKIATVILAASLITIVALPKLTAPIAVIDVLVLLWLAGSYVQLRVQMNRYRREECNEASR